ncbi:hypothetical protein [Actinoplanes sp. NPDC049316]|uniref:hypothetical protein n=1 Tax=Actinoplanes sp. NPDC049316 TaxID=3154727 RepID=UPI003417BE53
MTRSNDYYTRRDDTTVPRARRRRSPAVTGTLWLIGGVAFVGGGAGDIAGYPVDGLAPSAVFLFGVLCLVIAWRRSARAHREADPAL